MTSKTGIRNNNPVRLALLLGLTAVVSISAMAKNRFPEFSAFYKAYKAGIKLAESRVMLRRAGNGYKYISVTEPGGIVSLFRKDVVTETSIWNYDKNNKVKVSEYTFKHMKGKKRKKYRHVRFNWKDMTAVSQTNQHTWNLKLNGATYDQFAVQLAVMQDLKNTGATLTYAIARDNRLRTYTFEVVRKEKIRVPAGTFETVVIKRVRKKKKKTTYMWCAPKLGYLPVKVKHVEKSGSSAYMELVKVSGF